MGWPKKSAVSLLFCPFLRFFGPRRAPFPCLGIFYPRFVRQNCAFFTPQLPLSPKKSMGRIDTKKAQETKKSTERGIRVSGPVLRDTAGLSQRYPPIACYGVFVRRTQEGCGGLGGENPGIAFRAAGQSANNFPAASKFAGKLFQQ